SLTLRCASRERHPRCLQPWTIQPTARRLTRTPRETPGATSRRRARETPGTSRGGTVKRLSRGAAFSAALAMTCVPLTAVASPVTLSSAQTAGAASSADPKEPGFAAEQKRADRVHAQLGLAAQQGLVVRNVAPGPDRTTTVRYDR